MRSWIILIVATLLLVAILYPLLKRPVHAALAAAVIFTVGFQIYAWWKLGYMDPFWPIAVVVSGGVSFAVGLAALVAWRAIWSSGGSASTTVSAADVPVARAN